MFRTDVEKQWRLKKGASAKYTKVDDCLQDGKRQEKGLPVEVRRRDTENSEGVEVPRYMTKE